MHIKLTIHGRFFSVKCKLCSGLGKIWWLSALLMIVFARFEFDWVIYYNFCLF